MEEFDKAIEYFNRSLTEHRTPEILAKLRDVPSQIPISRLLSHPGLY
jgi:hypothetical protein